MLSNYTKRISGTFDVAKEVVLGNFAKVHEEYEKHCCWERYETLGKIRLTHCLFNFTKVSFTNKKHNFLLYYNKLLPLMG